MVKEGIYWDIAFAEMGYICTPYGPFQPTRYTFSGDTLIAGNIYKKVKYYYAYPAWGPSPNCPPFLFDTIAIIPNDNFYRDDTIAQQVLRYSATTNLVDTVFDFSLNQGDTMNYASPYQFFPVDTVFFTTTNDGVSRKTLASNYCIFPDVFSPSIVEGLGSERGFMVPPSPGFFEGGPWIMCIKDTANNNIVGYNSDCYGYISGLKDEVNYSDLSVYPNPNSGTIYISPSFNARKLNIYSINGQLIFQQSIEKEVDCIEIPMKLAGLYLVNLFNTKNIIVHSEIFQFY